VLLREIDLVGKTIEQATAELAQIELTLGTQTPRTDEAIPQGSIIGIDPATHPQIAKGEAVNVIVSTGPAPVVVPSIPPTTAFDAAAKMLTDTKLVPARGAEFSDTVPRRSKSSGPSLQQARRCPRLDGHDHRVEGMADDSERLGSIGPGRRRATAGRGFSVSGVQAIPFRTVTGTSPPAGTRARSGTGVVIITRN